jgi:hypothetical protein
MILRIAIDHHLFKFLHFERLMTLKIEPKLFKMSKNIVILS